MSDVRVWLDSIGLRQYADAFEENEIDWDLIPDLDHEILRDIGISAAGARMRILRAVRALDLGESESQIVTDRGPLPRPDGEAERRQVTVMFADLVGSTELSRRLDPEDLRKINRIYQDAAKAAVEQSGGYVARYMGDGVLAYFGYPQAHEDAAERALRAGLTLAETVPALHPEVALAVRIGIATGPVVVGDIVGEGAAQERAVVGETPNLAARLQGQAEPNTVVISEATKALTTGLYELEALPAQDLKGFAEEVTAFRVRAEMRGRSRFAARSGVHLSALVGREEELELLARRWSRAREGQGQAVLVVAEPGIGKSRLLQHLQAEIDTEPHATLFLQCSPYHEASALYPTIASFEQMLRFAEVQGDDQRLDVLRHHLEQMEAGDDQTLGLLAYLLSIATEGRFPGVQAMDAAQRREQTLQALVDYVRRRADHAPVLCAFEDVHWADPTTRELLGRLVEAVQSTPAFLIATTRPSFEAPWADLAHVQLMRLSRLGAEAARQLLTSASGMTTLPDAVVRTVLNRAEGNPLFIEELTRTVVQSPETMAGAGVIPSTLRDSLIARLDASPSAKAVAQCAAVIGRSFEHRILSEVWEGSPGELAGGLDVLEGSALVSKMGEGATARYAFKHALVRDAAYASLLHERRAHLHARVVSAIDELAPETRSTAPEFLAQHCTQAGLSALALELWLSAIERANARSASEECLAHVAAAFPLLAELPAGEGRDLIEVDLQLARAMAEEVIRGHAAKPVWKAYARARDLCGSLDQQERLMTALHGCARYHMHHGESAQARACAQRMREIANANDDPAMRVRAYQLTGVVELMASDNVSARENLERALNELGVISGSTGKAEPLREIAIASNLVAVYSNLGNFGQALEVAEDMAERVKHYGGKLQVVQTLSRLHQVLVQRHDYPRLLDESQRLYEMAKVEGFALARRVAELRIGIALGADERLVEGIERMMGVKREFESAGDRVGLNQVYWSPLVVYLARVGRIEEARRIGSEAVEATRGTVFWTWALLRQGEVLRLAGDHRLAEVRLNEAMASARACSARGWELEVTMSLAILWRDQGKPQQAHSLLAALYDWFTEDPECEILKETRTLLAELA